MCAAAPRSNVPGSRRCSPPPPSGTGSPLDACICVYHGHHIQHPPCAAHERCIGGIVSIVRALAAARVPRHRRAHPPRCSSPGCANRAAPRTPLSRTASAASVPAAARRRARVRARAAVPSAATTRRSHRSLACEIRWRCFRREKRRGAAAAGRKEGSRKGLSRASCSECRSYCRPRSSHPLHQMILARGGQRRDSIMRRSPPRRRRTPRRAATRALCSLPSARDAPRSRAARCAGSRAG